MPAKEITYHIVGGGIAGLACAWFLKDKNKNIRTIIYEANSRLGGRIYSYDDKELGCRLGNAVHAVVGANKFIAQFVKKEEWQTTKYFVDPLAFELDESLIKNKDYIMKAFCNIDVNNVAHKIKQNIFKSMFPYTVSKRKVWFSGQDLSQRIINPLASKVDEIYYNHTLKKILTQFGMAVALDFGKKQIDIGSKDKIIIALDNFAANKILNVPLLEYSQIVNIIYRTSQKIFLPRGASFVGLKSCIADWIFVEGDILTAVISDYKPSLGALSELSLKVWKEIDNVRGVNSAFVPPHKVMCYPRATILQNEKNNLQRPQSALTEYPNVFIAGDWTMKDHPCCMETAVKSAKRAIITSFSKV